MSKRIFLAIVALIWTLAILTPLSFTQAQVNYGPQIAVNGRFRVAIAANLATNVDVLVDGVLTSQVNIKPLYSSGFVTTTASVDHTVTLVQTGTSTQVGSSFTINLTPATDTTLVFLAGNTWLPSPLPNSGVAPSAGEATARVINLSASNPTITVQIDSTSTTSFSGIAYKAASSVYEAFPIGSHVISVPADNTIAPLTYNFLEGRVYSIFLFRDTTNNITKIVTLAEKSFSVGPNTVYLPTVNR